MILAAAGLLLAAVLFVSGATKLVDFPGTRAALATYGISRPGPARAAWVALVVVELALAAGLAAGWTPAAWVAAVVLGGFALAQVIALGAGRDGAPCACFGSRGRLTRGSALRAAGLAGLAVGVALTPRPELSRVDWLTLGLAAALAGVAVLAVVVLALAREVGALRLASSPRGALEVPHEGPEIGGRTALADQFGDLPSGRVALAVFGSEGCAMCRALKPVVAAFGRNPHVILREFDEVADAEAWAMADVPGSPYAVAFASDGTVLAKGTFNSGAQLESVLATAERRHTAPSGSRARS